MRAPIVTRPTVDVDGAKAQPPLRILHVMRAPVGGLFRHVLDLGRAQIAKGHAVGVFADSLTGGERAAREFARLRDDLRLGLVRTPIRRIPHWSDATALRLLVRLIEDLKPDIVHGHGAKGGFLARSASSLATKPTPVRAYTPHGGTVHFADRSLERTVYAAAEFALARLTDVFLFESRYAALQLARWTGPTRAESRVIVNGLDAAELTPVEPAPDAADFLFVGELRRLKGVGTLIEAMRRLQSPSAPRPRLAIVGAGPFERELSATIARLGLSHCVSLAGPMPAREAFRLGRTLVVPSHAESLPYIVLEAAGAQMPMIATNVGGIPEIFGPFGGRLVAPADPAALADAMRAAMIVDDHARRVSARQLAERVAEIFSLEDMYDDVMSGYQAGSRGRQAHGAGVLLPTAAATTNT